jgi:predicted NACHT family NTPase
MIREIVLQEFASRIIDTTIKLTKNTSIKSYTKEKDIFEALTQHLKFVKNWSAEVNFSDLRQPKSTKKVFVDLELYLQPLRVRISNNEKIDKFELRKIFDVDHTKHVALLGQVGSGKTTSLKFLCQSLLFNEGYFESTFSYPILIKLNDFNSGNKDGEYNRSIIINTIIEILGIKFDFQKLDEKSIDTFKDAAVTNFLNQNKVLLLLDGYDEMLFQNRRQVVLKEFERLVYGIDLSKIILTSRTPDFRLSTANLNTYEICPLTDEQISLFAFKWLEEQEEAEDFIKKIRKSPFYDTTIRPLTIAHLCAIYERNKDIPEKPKTVYKKIVTLLLEEWNQQGNVHRRSKYAHFENDRKFEFLSSLAYNLTTSNKNKNFTKENLEDIYYKIYQDYDLAKTEMIDVINEIESHNGLIVESGFQKFEFAHKSIQEYLSAEYIVKLPTIPNNRNNLLKLPNEIAIAIAISSQPSNYFTEFINERLIPLKLNLSFIKPFISRLLLEKVDFNQDINLAISTLKLYSIYLEGHKKELTQLSLFFIDDLVEEFEKLVIQVFKRNDKLRILTNYDVDQRLPTTDGGNILVLELNNIEKNSENLPNLLYCRESFVNNDTK